MGSTSKSGSMLRSDWRPDLVWRLLLHEVVALRGGRPCRPQIGNLDTTREIQPAKLLRNRAGCESALKLLQRRGALQHFACLGPLTYA